MNVSIANRANLNQWMKFFMFAFVVSVIMFHAPHADASTGTEFAGSVTKFNGWVTGNLGKVAALVALAAGSVMAAVKKEWSWFFGAIFLSMGIGVVVGIINASFTATI